MSGQTQFKFPNTLSLAPVQCKKNSEHYYKRLRKQYAAAQLVPVASTANTVVPTSAWLSRFQTGLLCRLAPLPEPVHAAGVALSPVEGRVRLPPRRLSSAAPIIKTIFVIQIDRSKILS
jgi:hypothetical protein